MRLHKCFKMALNMVLHSRLRSWLTIIGIVIGVASVIAIVAIGNGLSNEVNSQMRTLEADIITISPGYSRAMGFGGERGGFGSASSSSANDATLTNKDVQTLRSISDISYIMPQISGRVDIYYLGKKGTVSLTGIDQKVYSEISTTEISSGRNLDSADSNVVLIGSRLATEYFDKEIGINKMVTIEGRSFRVVGILDDNSNSVIMPINSAYEVLTDKEKFTYDNIIVKIKNAEKLDNVSAEITKKLYLKRHVNEKDQDFSVRTNAAQNDMRQQMTSTITTFLTAIASVSLLVGAVGIANTMFTSVLEKTKEIGIMKAIGARNNDVMLIFVMNAGIIGFVGGGLGIIFGLLISWFLTTLGMPSAVDFTTVFGMLGISILIGMVAGIIPAYQASSLNPVEALRSE